MRALITRFFLALALAALIAPALPDTAHAQGKRSSRNKGKSKSNGKGDKNKVFDFTGLDVTGQLRSPQLLYFLERATEELQRASLERRSFVPEMVRSIDEEAL